MADETTTDRLAEIEGQAADYTPPEGWRVLQEGETISAGDRWVRPADKQAFYALRIGEIVRDGTFIRRIEPQPQQIITPDDVAAEALAGVHDSAVVANPFQEIRELRRKLETTEAALLEQQQRNEQLVTQGSQQCMEIAELQAQVRFLKNRELTLGTRLEEEKAVNAKRLQQVEELRSEVSYVQGLLGTERRRVTQLEELVTSLRTINEAQEKAFNAAGKENTDLQHRLNVVAAEWAEQAETSRRLQIELDAREQVPQAVSDRFEEGWDKGTARAVETIAEWLEPIKAAIDAADNQDELARSGFFAIDIIRHLPHIMRSLTGLADED